MLFKEYLDTKWRMYREIIIHKLHQFVSWGHCAPSRSRHDILLCFIVNLDIYNQYPVVMVADVQDQQFNIRAPNVCFI